LQTVRLNSGFNRVYSFWRDRYTEVKV